MQTNGSLVYAEYAYGAGAGTETVNGVAFTEGFNGSVSYASPAGTNNNAFSTNTGTAAYNTILTGYAYDGSNPNTLTLGALTIGHSYQVELWSLDDRGGGLSARTYAFTSNAGSPTGSLGANTTGSFTGGSNDIFLGTFTATSTSEAIYVNGVGQSQTNFNAFELRDVTVPEPSTYLLLIVGGLTVWFVSRVNLAIEANKPMVYLKPGDDAMGAHVEGG